MPFIKTFHLCLGHQCTLCTITYRRSVVSEGMRNTIVRFWENAGILENVFSVNRIKPPQPGGFVVVLKVKIMMKQLPLVSWMFCFHFKILLLSLELFLFYFGCLFFFPYNYQISKYFISKERKERKYVRVTTVMYWASGNMNHLELKFLQLKMGTSVNKQTLKLHEKG